MGSNAHRKSAHYCSVFHTYSDSIRTIFQNLPLCCYSSRTVGLFCRRAHTKFIKSYAAVCLEGAIIILACIIYSAFVSSPPAVDPDASAVNMVWSYVGELIFGMLVLVGTVKMADRVSHEMFGV